MLGGLLNLKELAVSDVMIHRTKMIMIDAALPPSEIIAAVLKSGHTRLPIFRERPDNILGILNARDLLAALQQANGNSGQARYREDRQRPPGMFRIPALFPINSMRF